MPKNNQISEKNMNENSFKESTHSIEFKFRSEQLNLSKEESKFANLLPTSFHCSEMSFEIYYFRCYFLRKLKLSPMIRYKSPTVTSLHF